MNSSSPDRVGAQDDYGAMYRCKRTLTKLYSLLRKAWQRCTSALLQKLAAKADVGIQQARVTLTSQVRRHLLLLAHCLIYSDGPSGRPQHIEDLALERGFTKVNLGSGSLCRLRPAEGTVLEFRPGHSCQPQIVCEQTSSDAYEQVSSQAGRVFPCIVRHCKFLCCCNLSAYSRVRQRNVRQ